MTSTKLTYLILLNAIIGQLVDSVSVHVTLHTELSSSVPEFTVSCQSHGRPAKTVQWTINRNQVEEDSSHEMSQIIQDTSHYSVYDNRLQVKGRASGTYSCLIQNNYRHYLQRPSITLITGCRTITGIDSLLKFSIASSPFNTAAAEPTSLTANISQSNTTHVNISVSWRTPKTSAVTGYAIYYLPKGGQAISYMVSGGEAETQLLDGLLRGVTYNISIVALSQNLPSHLVGPITVIPGKQF